MATLEEAGYQREDNPAQAALLRELVNSLSSGKLLLMPTAEVWHLDEEQREDSAIAKLDKLIELVVSIRTAWIASPEGELARKVPGRRLGPLEGNMSGHELRAAAQALLNSMSRETRAEYAFLLSSQREPAVPLRSPAPALVLQGGGLGEALGGMG